MNLLDSGIGENAKVRLTISAVFAGEGSNYWHQLLCILPLDQVPAFVSSVFAP